MRLSDRRKFIDLVTTFKIIHGHIDVNPNSLFKTVGNNPERVTRNTSNPYNLIKQSSSLETRKNFFSNRIVDSWNNLPDDMKHPSKPEVFKQKLRKMMLETIN